MRGRARPTPDPFLLGPRPRGDDVAGRSGGGERERDAPGETHDVRGYASWRGGGRRRAAIPGGREARGEGADGRVWRGRRGAAPCQPDPPTFTAGHPPSSLSSPAAEDHRPTRRAARGGSAPPRARHTHARARQVPDSRSPPLLPHFPFPPRAARVGKDSSASGRRVGRRALGTTLMILPQVHLRKPCYDFYFL